MKLWVATGAVLLLAGAAVALLLVDSDLWHSSTQHRPDHFTTHLLQREPPRRPEHQAARRSHHQRPSPFALQPAGRHLPVDAEFAPQNGPKAGRRFGVHTGQVLWRHHAGTALPIGRPAK